jgi:predicted O-methyltransferase YrrM
MDTVVTPDEVLEEIERVAPAQGLPIIGPRRGEFLDEVVAEHNPSTILEVGTLVGYSAIRMGRHLKKGQKITCVELSEGMARVARSNFDRAGLGQVIEVVVGDATKVLPKLGGRLDMAFFDAVKEDYLGYLKAIEWRLHPGSVVVADNVKSHAEEVAAYLDYVRNSGKYSSTYRESPPNYGSGEGDAVEISVRL